MSDGLNDRQREAVETTEGPLLVVAGAGSGKTRVITYRIANLMRHGVPADSILALSFTNKAAGEMAERVAALASRRPYVSTFHSACARILRMHAGCLGYPPSFVIHDAQDQRRMIRNCLKRLAAPSDLLKPAKAQWIIGRFKTDMLTPDDVKKRAVTCEDELTADVYAEYEKRMKESGALDFDDLLLLTLKLFDEHADVRDFYRERFQYVLIDEYQDTNRAQFLIARHLAAGHLNICATGDPDQAIYSWRGADISNIVEFETHFPGAHTVVLDENYRSTGHILSLANAVIGQNAGRKEKNLWSNLGDGTKPVLAKTDDEYHEARAAVGYIREFISDGIAPDEIAVFYRTNAQSRLIETELVDAAQPYQVIGAVEFFARMEVKDVLAYLKLAVNPLDVVSFERAVNTPSRGIGEKTFAKMAECWLERGIDVFAAETPADLPRLSKNARAGFGTFLRVVRQIRENLEKPVHELIKDVIDAVDYVEYLRQSYPEDHADREENLKELVNAAAEFNETRRGKGKLTDFLEDIALVSEVDDLDRCAGRISLMTMHAAKGLEFDGVVVVGLNETILPHARSSDDPEKIEEECRLFYVACTRAKKRLALTYCRSRRQSGNAGPVAPSRFLESIPTAHCDFVDKCADEPDGGDDAEYGGLAKGDIVRHEHFGIGIVLGFSGSGRRLTALVQFEHYGKKRLIIEDAGLTPVPEEDLM